MRRSKTGQFKKEVNVGRSLAGDRRRKAKTRVPKGHGIDAILNAAEVSLNVLPES